MKKNILLIFKNNSMKFFVLKSQGLGNFKSFFSYTKLFIWGGGGGGVIPQNDHLYGMKMI